MLALGSASYDLEVIDDTKGVSVEEGGVIGVQTVRPAVEVRRSALVGLGIAVGDLIDGEVTLNGATWRIKSFLDNGDEFRLILMQADQMDKREEILARLVGVRPVFQASPPPCATRMRSANGRGLPSPYSTPTKSADERPNARTIGARAQPRRDDAEVLILLGARARERRFRAQCTARQVGQGGAHRRAIDRAHRRQRPRRYAGCSTHLGHGRSMEGSMGVQFTFAYVLRPEQL